MRTRLSGSRRRSIGAVLALTLLLAAASIPVSGLASARTAGRRAATLVLEHHDPATIHGSGFRPHRRVRVMLVSTSTFVHHPVANSRGAFTTTFATVVDRCTSWSASASQPGRTTVRITGAKPECAPASTP